MFQVGPNQRMEGVAAMRIGNFLLLVKSSAWLLGGEDSFIFSLPLLLSSLSSHLADSVCASGGGGKDRPMPAPQGTVTAGRLVTRLRELGSASSTVSGETCWKNPQNLPSTATHPSFDLPGHVGKATMPLCFSKDS